MITLLIILLVAFLFFKTSSAIFDGLGTIIKILLKILIVIIIIKFIIYIIPF